MSVCLLASRAGWALASRGGKVTEDPFLRLFRFASWERVKDPLKVPGFALDSPNQVSQAPLLSPRALVCQWMYRSGSSPQGWTESEGPAPSAGNRDGPPKAGAWTLDSKSSRVDEGELSAFQRFLV